MSLAGLLSVIAADPQLQRALSQGDADTDLVAPPALRPFLAASIATSTGAADSATADSTTGDSATGQPRFVLAVTATAREAENLTSSLGSLLPEGTVAYFPAWETLPHERLSPRSDTSGRCGSPCCAGWPTRTPAAPGREPSPCWSPRYAACSSRW